MFSDLKYAIRQLTRSPGFTLFAVLTLALGIGANTAIFRVIDSVLLSKLPVKDPEHLAFLTDPDAHGFWVGGTSGDRDLLTYPEFQYLRDHNKVFSGLLAVNGHLQWLPVTVPGIESPGLDNHVGVNMVSGDYFSVLGVNAAVGRTFGSEVDKVRDASPVAVIGYSYWQSQFGGDPGILTKRVRIRDTSYDIIGVAQRGFAGETVRGGPVAIYVPISMQAELIPGSDWLSPDKTPLSKIRWLQVIGRLKTGVSIGQAQAAINVDFQQYLEDQATSQLPAFRRKDFLNQHLVLTNGSRGGSTLRKGYEEPLILLMALVGLLLLIASANVANLLLARANARQREIAIRIAVGAKPGRIFRQLLTESLLLSAIGGAGGFLLSQWGQSLLLQLVGLNLDLAPNGSILIFTLTVSLLVGVLFGTAPGLQAARLDLTSVLKGTIGAAASSGRFSVGKILVIAQVALSLLLLIVAGLFVHSFQKLATTDLGYDHDHLLIIPVDPIAAGYKASALGPLYQNLIDRIDVLPGVRGVTFSGNGLFTNSEGGGQIAIDGYASSGKDMSATFDTVGPNYFSAIGIPILLGREIGPSDTGSGQRYGVINQTMSRYYFGDANPIGRRIRDAYTPSHPDFIVAGVVGDAKYNSAREGTPRRFYVPFYNPMFGQGSVYFEIRAKGNPSGLVAALRDAIKQAAPNLPQADITTMNQQVDGTLGLDRLLIKLSGFFGILAALLASIGIYSIMSYAVARRTHEIGIRTALGAQHASILWLILSESLFLVAIGVAIGVPAAIVSEKSIASLLFGLPPADPGVLAAAVALMFIVAALAGYVPARRAARVDPLVALRTE